MFTLLRSPLSVIRRELIETVIMASRGLANSSGYVCINNKVELYYEQYGDKSNHTILCIPGAAGTGHGDFCNQLDNLSDSFNMIAYDPRGYGQSQNVKRQFPLTYFHQDASDASIMMKTLGYSKYSVLGWSDGGIAGMILAAQDKSVQNLVIFGAAAYVTDEDAQLIESTRDLAKWSERMRKPLEQIYGKKGLQTLWSDFCDGYCAFASQPDGNICIPELSEIKCPTLVVHGAKDPMVPNFQAEFLHKHIKDSKLVIMPEGKHNLHMRYFQEFNEMTKEFIDSR